MTRQNFDINKLRVASPCAVGWETMTGDARRRFCGSCRHSVYNFSEMTAEEIRALIAESEDRICGRLYTRADGTVLTKDCPVGLRKYQKRVARFAGAALTAVLGLFSVSFGQKEDVTLIDASKSKIVRTESQNRESVLSGVITDPNGATVPGAKIKLLKKGQKKSKKAVSDADGKYVLDFLSEGIYELEIKFSGFKTIKVENLNIKSKEKIELDFAFVVASVNVTVGLVTEMPLIDGGETDLTTAIAQRTLKRLPDEK